MIIHKNCFFYNCASLLKISIGVRLGVQNMFSRNVLRPVTFNWVERILCVMYWWLISDLWTLHHQNLIKTTLKPHREPKNGLWGFDNQQPPRMSHLQFERPWKPSWMPATLKRSSFSHHLMWWQTPNNEVF